MLADEFAPPVAELRVSGDGLILGDGGGFGRPLELDGIDVGAAGVEAPLYAGGFEGFGDIDIELQVISENLVGFVDVDADSTDLTGHVEYDVDILADLEGKGGVAQVALNELERVERVAEEGELATLEIIDSTNFRSCFNKPFAQGGTDETCAARHHDGRIFPRERHFDLPQTGSATVLRAVARLARYQSTVILMPSSRPVVGS